MNQRIILLLYLILLILTLPLVLYIIRPHVNHNNYHYFLIIIVNSYPNFLEAVCGFLAFVICADWIRFIFPIRLRGIKSSTLYVGITVITGVYVFSRELKLHHIGGSNTYDLNDIIASIIGLLVVNVLAVRNQWLVSK